MTENERKQRKIHSQQSIFTGSIQASKGLIYVAKQAIKTYLKPMIILTMQKRLT